MLVAIVTDFYKCTMCGEETRQYVNGSIRYLKLDERDREFIEKSKEVFFDEEMTLDYSAAAGCFQLKSPNEYLNRRMSFYDKTKT